MRKSILAALAGGIALFVLGFLIYGVVLAGFYAGNLGSATGVVREVPVWWALCVSQFGLAAVITYVAVHASVSSASEGLKMGAVFGLLFGVAIAFDLYAVTNWSNVTVAFVEPLVTAVRISLAGGVIGAVLGTAGDG